QARSMMNERTLTPNKAAKYGFTINKDGVKRTAFDLLKYNEIGFKELIQLWPELETIHKDVAEQLEIEAKYSGYLYRQEADIRSFKEEENLSIPDSIDYDTFPSLSNEIKSKLKQIRPTTLGAASRIPGMTPAALTAILTNLR